MKAEGVKAGSLWPAEAYPTVHLAQNAEKHLAFDELFDVLRGAHCG